MMAHLLISSILEKTSSSCHRRNNDAIAAQPVVTVQTDAAVTSPPLALGNEINC